MSVICLQETKLSSKHMLSIPGYLAFRQDYESGKISCGGVAIYVKNSIYCEEITCSTALQAVAVTVHCPSKITLCSLYLPPGETIDQNKLNSLINQLPNPRIIFTDVNARNTSWGSDATNHRGHLLLKVLDQQDLIVLNDGSPTYLCPRHGSLSHIDITASSPSILTKLDWKTADDYHSSDQIPILTSMIPSNSTTEITQCTAKIWQKKKADWNKFKTAFIETAQHITPNDINIDTFNNLLIEAAAKSIPKVKIGTNKKIPIPWWDNDCTEAIRNRKHALRKLTKCPNDTNLLVYRQAKAGTKRLIIEKKKLSWPQSSGLSPSPTEESGHKAPSGQETHPEEELKSSVTDEKPLEEPESNDTSYGVEATAVRTLAASTGTVAILGTTAKVKELNEPELVDFRLSPTEPAIIDGKEVLAQKDNADITAAFETKEVVIADSDNALKECLEKHREEDVLETKEDLRSLETGETKKDRDAKNEIKEENMLENREEKVEKEGVEKIVEKGEVNEKVDYKTRVKQGEEVIAKEGKDGLSLISVPDKIDMSVMVETTNPDSSNIVIGIEKELVRIVDYQEKKDRAHEPKIVEEMSVKKEENLNKASHPGDISLKKEENFEKILSIDKQEQDLMNEERPTKIAITTEEFNKTTPESEPVSPEASKTEEDNEISSEQLKTNSLSDMSLSENLNSECEEAAREAAKALELKEMVASLSATANRVTLDYEISENINDPKDISRDDTRGSTSLHEEPEPAKKESSAVNDVADENIERNVNKSLEIPKLICEHSSEKEASTVSIPETSEETISSSENSQGERESNRLKEEKVNDSADTTKVKITEYDIQEKENDVIETEPQHLEENKYDIVTKDKITTQETPLPHQECEIQKKAIEIQQNLLKSKEIEEKAVEGEVNGFKQKEAELKNNENRVTETRKFEEKQEKERGEEHGETAIRECPNEKDHKHTNYEEIEQTNKEKENKVEEKSEMNGNAEKIAAATIIQSGFRGYQVRKHFKESGAAEEVKQILDEGKEVFEEEKTLLNGSISIVPEMLDEKGQLEEQEKDLLERSESKTSETEEEKVKHVPESLMKIARAEVDKICKDAEKATESLMTPPHAKDNSEIEIQDEEFPAPPDELLTSESQNEEIKEDQSSSETQSTEPTMPLGSNHTEGDSSKTEDTTAPSLAESEMPKPGGQSPSLQNDDFRLESSVTENINTEIAMQRDSTEGELTIEEDSTKEDDVLAPTGSDVVSKADGEDSLTPEEEKAATVIQAGYRGFKTRKRLREESSTISDTGTVEQQYITNESSVIKSSIKDEDESNSSNSLPCDNSEKELNDSAKKIQAGVRGYLVRKKQKVERDAAVTIQSHFRGFKTRQRLKQKST